MLDAARKRSTTLESRMQHPESLPTGDRELIMRLAEGDEPAMGELISIYGQRMYAYALRLTGNPTQAEDVVQDSLVAAWQGAKRFRGSGRLIAWLLGIIHHRAMAGFKRSKQAIEQGLGEVAAELEADGLTSEEQTALSEQRELLRAGLRGLSPEHRAVLELVFYQGLSLQEAAEVCGVPLGTVKSRLNYAKASLRGILKRAGFSAEDFE